MAQNIPIDWQRARQLHEKRQRGEKLTPEDQAYLDRARQALREGRGPSAAQGSSSAEAAKGLTPLSELAEPYKGQDGGLYGAGANEPPAAHRALAEQAIAQIRLLGPDGLPAADGKIVLASIGMSNTSQEFSFFKPKADADPRKAPCVVVVDCAQGGVTGTRWAAEDAPWETADRVVANVGKATPAQVQAVWIKQAERNPSQLGAFPKHAEALRDNLVRIVLRAKQRWPNLRVAYLSSRTYAGYAVTQLNPEPYAYEGAFAVRWAIQEQMRGDARLNADPAKGIVVAPVMLWGPYLWAAGPTPLKLNGLAYQREDFEMDGTHPSRSGRKKVAQALLTFFTTNPLAQPWFAPRP